MVMAELMARGAGPAEECNWALPQGSPVTLGRVAGKCDLAVPWDQKISGVHAQLSWEPSRCLLRVRRLERSVNPVYLERKDQGFEEFLVLPGQIFSIGATHFTCRQTTAGPGSTQSDILGNVPNFQSSASLAALRQARYTDADKRIEILASLPELIRFSPSEQELESKVAEVLVAGVANADIAGVVRLTSGEDAAEPVVEVRASAQRADLRAGTVLEPSRRLVHAAVQRRQAVFYRWDHPIPQGFTAHTAPQGFTAHTAFHWALCVPLPETVSATNGNWALYVAGNVSSPQIMAPEAGPTSDLKFAGIVADIFASLREVHKLQAEQVRRDASLALAHEIQAGLFPRSLPAVDGYELAAGSRSADATGGDYYDVLTLASGKLGLVIADVCGHGLGPSLLMASLRATLRGLAVHEPPPDVLVSDVGQALYADLSPQFRFITMLYGALCPLRHHFCFANAGHGPVVLHFQSATDHFRSLADDDKGGGPLGILRERYQSGDPVALLPGDILILGSDGIVEAGHGKEKFGMERLMQLIRQLKANPLQELHDEIMEAAMSFEEGARPDDDLTLLLVRRNR
jgi:serine phosphatase RsbU (regulator of sigma subunit)